MYISIHIYIFINITSSTIYPGFQHKFGFVCVSLFVYKNCFINARLQMKFMVTSDAPTLERNTYHLRPHKVMLNVLQVNVNF